MVSIKLSENGGAAPEAVPYMPAGINHICCTVDGKAGERAVMADKEACERLQADLQEMLQASKEGNKARPVILFDHKSGPAAAEPQSFEWDDNRGILLRVKWTQAGREAVEGSNYGYISPTFRLEKGGQRINGLLKDVVEVGSLVNDPAFERNECIAASKVETYTETADEEHIRAAHLPPFRNVEKGQKKPDNNTAANGGGTINQPKKDDMENIKKKLGLAPEATSDDVSAAIDALTKKSDEHKKRVEEVEAECAQHREAIKKHKESAADGFIDRLKRDGKIAHQDEETAKAAREVYLNDPESAERIYAAMKPIVPAVENSEKIHANRVPDGHGYAKMSIADCYATIEF